MHIESLTRMANQIGIFFEAMPDRPEALEGIAQHIKRFWEPRMRSELLAYVDGGDTELNGMVLEAIGRHRALLEPAQRRA
jgi:formate dehydrogenase subunit delta